MKIHRFLIKCNDRKIRAIKEDSKVFTLTKAKIDCLLSVCKRRRKVPHYNLECIVCDNVGFQMLKTKIENLKGFSGWVEFKDSNKEVKVSEN